MYYVYIYIRFVILCLALTRCERTNNKVSIERLCVYVILGGVGGAQNSLNLYFKSKV